MNERDFDTIVGRWLAEEAPSEAPDRIVRAVADRTALMPRTRSGPFGLGGLPSLAYAVAVAVVVAVAFLAGIGFAELRKIGTQQTPVPIPSTAATEAPTPTPSQAGLVPPRPTDIPDDGTCEPDRQCLGLLEPGSYQTEFLDPNFSFTISEPGWQNLQSSGGELDIRPLDAPGDELHFLQDPSVRTANGRAVGGIGSTVDELTAFWAGRSDLVIDGMQPTAVGGLEGVELDVTLSASAPDALNGCPVEPCVMLAASLDPAEMPSWLWELSLWRGAAKHIWVLDAGSHRVLLVATAWDGSQLDELVARFQPIVDSIQFVESVQ
jgi:hypothetical protein